MIIYVQMEYAYKKKKQIARNKVKFVGFIGDIQKFVWRKKYGIMLKASG